MGSVLERLLNRSLQQAATLSDAEQRQSAVRRCLRWFQRFTRACCIYYALFVLLLWWLQRSVGEANLTLAFLLYAPASVWLLPLPLFGFAALLFDWRSLITLLLTAIGCLWLLMGMQLDHAKSAPPNVPVLTVLTFSRGESAGTSMQPFKNAVKPDVFLLQDATGRARGYVKSQGYEEFGYGEDIGEFAIVSKFPITSRELIKHGDEAIAARFTIDWNGKSVVIYNMHLPTPRHALASLKRGAFLWGVLGVGGRWAEKRQSYEGWWQQHIARAEALAARVEAETLPCLLAGDSNSPAQGRAHHVLSRRFVDAHETSGGGFGYTFPGTTRNPLSLGGPWLRIDKILSNQHWQALWSKAEPDRASQHRAMAAAFALVQ